MSAKLHYLGDDNRGPRGGKLLVFHCPGCGHGHPFEIECPNGDGWTWNGDYERPTFTPSLLCNQHKAEARCHLFVRDGRIEFLTDCHHQLAGKTVDVPDWEEAS